MGIVSALGTGLASHARQMRANTIGLGPVTLFPSQLETRVPVCEINSDIYKGLSVFPGEAEIPNGRCRRLSLAAISEAVRRSGHQAGTSDFQKMGLFLGSISGDILEWENRARDGVRTGKKVPILLGPGLGRMTSVLADHLKLQGPILSINTACTSSANALFQAIQSVRSGQTRTMLVVGADALNSMTYHGFASLMLLDPDGCRPFDKNRNGIQIGEGAAAIVIETGCRRDDSDDPEIIGFSSMSFPFHPTSSSEDGKECQAVMEAALADAALNPNEITAIKVHGTGSVNNDRGEGRAIARIFGSSPPPFTSLKRYFGHTMGAAGMVELAAFLSCIQHGFIPRNPGFESPDPDIGISPLTEHLCTRGGNFLLNYFGFGGSSVSFIVKYLPTGNSHD